MGGLGSKGLFDEPKVGSFDTKPVGLSMVYYRVLNGYII